MWKHLSIICKNENMNISAITVEIWYQVWPDTFKRSLYQLFGVVSNSVAKDHPCMPQYTQIGRKLQQSMKHWNNNFSMAVPSFQADVSNNELLLLLTSRTSLRRAGASLVVPCTIQSILEIWFIFLVQDTKTIPTRSFWVSRYYSILYGQHVILIHFLPSNIFLLNCLPWFQNVQTMQSLVFGTQTLKRDSTTKSNHRNVAVCFTMHANAG